MCPHATAVTLSKQQPCSTMQHVKMGSKYNCPELTSSNWSEFSMRFKSLVAAKGFSGALTDKESAHTEKVKGLLGQYVSREFLRLVDRAGTAKEAWDQLEARFKQANAANAVQLH